MYGHPNYGLRLHDDAELGEMAGATVVARETLHQWPLSCVQRLDLADGRRLIYKVSGEPTVEGAFYARAHSPLLAEARIVYRDAQQECLLLPWLKGRPPNDAGYSPEARREIAERVLAGLAALSEDLPCYLDLRPAGGWEAVIGETLGHLQSLRAQGALTATTEAVIGGIAAAAESGEVRAALAEDVGLVHGDLHADNVFVLPDGLRVIDWQRPIYGPRGLDRLTLLGDLLPDEAKALRPGLHALQTLLLVQWIVDAAVHWIPRNLPAFDRWIAAAARDGLGLPAD